MKTTQTKLMVILLFLVGLLSYGLIGKAGSLDPNDPPGPTMKTLDEIYTQIAASSSPIKQVVRGVVISYHGNECLFSQDLSSSINPSKSMVFLSPTVIQNDPPDFRPFAGACLISLTSSQITIRIDEWTAGWEPNRYVSYQIIEYK
jgi:hypothetical protein